MHVEHLTVSDHASHPVQASLAVNVLEDGFVQPQLQAGLVKHLPLIRVPGDQPVDLNRFALTNPVAASLGLASSRSGAKMKLGLN